MVCLVGCIGLGLSLRFANLDLKVYSYDEAITSLRISGHTWQENDPQQVTFPAGYSDYFIYRPSSAVRETIQTDQGYQLLSVDGIAQDELLMVSTLPVAASTE